MPLRRLVTRVSRGHVTQGEVALVIVVLLVIGMSFALIINAQQNDDIEELVRQNRARIAEGERRDRETQLSRIESCKQNYEGVRQAFDRFLQPRPGMTRQQRQNIRDFNADIDRLKAGCEKQTSQENGGNP